MIIHPIITITPIPSASITRLIPRQAHRPQVINWSQSHNLTIPINTVITHTHCQHTLMHTTLSMVTQPYDTNAPTHLIHTPTPYQHILLIHTLALSIPTLSPHPLITSLTPSPPHPLSHSLTHPLSPSLVQAICNHLFSSPVKV